MGQRSQIYIRIWDKDNDNPKLYAKYYGWNFGERMISRAKHGIEYIKTHLKYIDIDSTQEKINRIFDVNFDMQDILLTSDIIKEWLEEFSDYYEANEYIFNCVANNDGKLFIDVTKEGEIRYCFTDYDLKILTPTKYMNWDCSGWQNSRYLSEDEIETCKDNIKYISKNAKLMTKEELQEFIDFDYSKQIIELAKDLKIEVDPKKIHKTSIEKQEQDQSKEENDISEVEII